MKQNKNIQNKLLGVCGSHTNENYSITELALELSRKIYHNNYDIVTGACPGYPQDFTLGYMNERNKNQDKNIGLILGISPFGNPKKHQDMGMTQDGLDRIIYTGLGDNLEIPECYSCRNPIIINTSNIGLIFPGTQGTINEANLYLKSGKPVVFVDGFNESFDKEIAKLVNNNSSYLKSNEPKDILKFISGVK